MLIAYIALIDMGKRHTHILMLFWCVDIFAL